ncbi:protein TIME FOR COFFEE-like isoform X2 [Tripterygium wilfordii]|uniref:protein TIME FOR COFFEE-like isoform X2 n=1 Tax=Tripterygium wilfordii TaxID=458696 RepID=UPI0018F81C66|nr:protein TIME FOR COFFEE-like isoform X2 [Tripterygium wilfordii]
MDRNREGRRVNMAASNGLSRRRHRTSSLIDSPEGDCSVELQETARLRDRGSVKKDRDRERDRDRDRDRERVRDRDRDRLSRSKRRRAERLMHGNNRENGVDESTEESVNDEEEEDDDDGGGGAAERVGTSMRLLPPNPPSLSSSSIANHLHRKSFPPPSTNFKAATTSPWRPTDDMIGVTVPRKARSVCANKRSHDWISSVSGVGEEQFHRQTSTSPARSNGPNIPAMSSTAPILPSSSMASLKKKMHNGTKQRPLKSSSKSSSAQDEIEIEIAEVLYGMLRQPQVPSKQEAIGNDSAKLDYGEVSNNKSSADAKSRVSSPISNSPSTAPQSSLILHTNGSTAPTNMSAVAPKRKRPRPVKYEDENPSAFTVRTGGPVTSTTKVEIDPSEQPAKAEIPSHNSDNGGISYDLVAGPAASAQAELPLEASDKPDGNFISDSKPLTEESEIRDLGETKEEPESLKKESHSRLQFDVNRENLNATKANSTLSQIESQREKFQIDLMAPPPVRSSPERDAEIDFVAVDGKAVTDVETETKSNGKEDVSTVKSCKGDVNAEVEENKAKVAAEVESEKRVVSKDNKTHQNGQKQRQLHNPDKNAQSNSLPLPVSMSSWPGGLPPMGYMPPLQGVVSMDGSSVSSTAMQPPHLLSSHARPKRCATHCYIARNIHYHQQFSRMNPFWSAAAGSAFSYGAKACNVGVVPSTELLANIPARGSAQDKGQGLAIFPGNSGKDKGSPAVNMVDGAQRNQILLQQAVPAGGSSNILHGPAFIFPLSQQHAAAAASVSVKSSPAATGHGASSSTSSTATASAAAAASAMSFSYPTIPGNETQYLAILQNGAYSIPIPAHVGAPPAYRGAHAQAMPFFNGSFYSSQMVHQSSQHQQQQIPATQSQQGPHQQGHQNPSISSGSSSSQKHLQMPPSSGGNGNLLGFSAQKNLTSQSLQLQQRHQPQNQVVSHQARQLESEAGSVDSPSTGDSRVSRANMSIYGQSFTMPFPPPNFATTTPAAMRTATRTNGNHIEKKQHSQQQGSKAGVESLPSQAFAMSFASMNGAATMSGLDISSLAQNHALRQSLPESTRHGYHVMAAAQAPQHKKNYHASEEGKTGGSDALNVDEDRKAMAGKIPSTVGQSIAFFRSDATGSTLPGSPVVDSSARTINLGSASHRASNSITSAAVSTVESSSAQQQLQYERFQHQHLMVHKLQQQAQAAAVAARGKTPGISNGGIYPDQVISSSSVSAKFPNVSAFPQSLVQGSSSPGQSPQWKNSARTASQVPSPTTTSSSVKNLPQQQGRSQQSQTQISFASNPKTSTAGQVQLTSVSNQSPSSPMVVGSPTSSISRSTGGSPRTTASTSTGNKGGQASALSSQPAKSPSSLPSRKSSPVSGRSVPSFVGNPNISSSTTGTKSQLPQQQQQQQLLQKHAVQQAQMLFPSAYMQVQGQHAANTTNATSASSGFYLQRHRNEQHQQLQSSSATSSSGMLSLCPPVAHNTSTSDPTKAIAAAAAAAVAASNMKGGILTSQGLMRAPFAATQSSAKPHQLVPTGFSYVHPVPTPVQVKPTEQKHE